MTLPQVDINSIATDLNNKADCDLTNVNDLGTSKVAHWSMPSNTYDELTLGANYSTYTAPADGYFICMLAISNSWGTVTLQLNNASCYGGYSVGAFTLGNIIPAKKGDVLKILYSADTGQTVSKNVFRFIYAEGSKEEAN